MAWAEYKLRFSYPTAGAVEAMLRAAPLFAGVEPTYSSFDFRLPETTGSMPNASVRIEPDGLYFCDHGGAQSILDELVQRITASYGAPGVEALE